MDVYNAANPNLQGWRMYFTPTHSFTLNDVQLYLKKTGTPTGSVMFNVYINGSSYSISDGSFDSATLTGSYALTTVALSQPVNFVAGTQYMFWIFGDIGGYASGGGGVWMQSMTVANCGNSNFGTFYEMTQSGIADSGMSLDLHFRSPAYVTTGPTATFTGDSGTAGSTWFPSTFSPNENPMSQTGTVLYDIGASDTNVATYSQTGLTKDQVLAASALTGQYLFISASLYSTGFNSSAIGDIAIQHSK